MYHEICLIHIPYHSWYVSIIPYTMYHRINDVSQPCASTKYQKMCLKHMTQHKKCVSTCIIPSSRYMSQPCGKPSMICHQSNTSRICQLINDMPQLMCKYMPQSMHPSVSNNVPKIYANISKICSNNMPQTIYQNVLQRKYHSSNMCLKNISNISNTCINHVQ
jgi:hypothetical protein